MDKKVHRKRKRMESLSGLKKKAWKLLSLIVRQSHADRSGMVRCYTCGSIHFWQSGLTGMHAGHAIGGRSGAVLWDESLIRPQCYRCNAKPPFGLAGNYPVFTNKLISENGLEWHEKKLSDSRKVVKWTAADIKERIEQYEKRLEELNKKRALKRVT